MTMESTGNEKNVLLDVIDKFVNHVIEEAERRRDENDLPCADYFTAMMVVKQAWHKEGGMTEIDNA